MSHSLSLSLLKLQGYYFRDAFRIFINKSPQSEHRNMAALSLDEQGFDVGTISKKRHNKFYVFSKPKSQGRHFNFVMIKEVKKKRQEFILFLYWFLAFSRCDWNVINIAESNLCTVCCCFCVWVPQRWFALKGQVT